MSHRHHYSYGHDDGKCNIVDGRVLVYTDGSCIDNGRPNARAGYGAYFGPNDKKNLSEPVPSGRQTSQRAEILAAYYALKVIYRAGYDYAEIRTDSHYLKDCVEEYISRWKKNRWVRADGRPVVNKRELQDLDRYNSKMLEVIYTHVPRDSHSWNREAHKLAKAGAEARRNDNYSDDSDD